MLLEKVEIFPFFFFFEILNCHLKLVAFDLKDGFVTIGKLYFYTLSKESESKESELNSSVMRLLVINY